jgi:hypothetical protein
VTFWTGKEALFLGGDLTPPCADGGDCDGPSSLAIDGAAYDPGAHTWRPVAGAPETIAPYSARAVAGSTLYLWGTKHLLSYDVPTDEWHSHPLPDDPRYAEGPGGDLVALDASQLATTPSERKADEPSGWVFTVATETWRSLPEDPLGASFDRRLTAAGTSVVLSGHDTAALNSANTDPPVLHTASLDPSRKAWRELPDTSFLGGGEFSWTGKRLIMPAIGGADGGQVGNYRRTVPFGGAFDPDTGTSSRIRDTPNDFAEFSRAVFAPYAFDGALYATGGYVYDDADGSWRGLTPPQRVPQEPGDAVWMGRTLLLVGGIDRDTNTRVGGAWALLLPD